METRKDIMYRIFDDLICKTPKIICCDGDISILSKYLLNFNKFIT